MYISFQPKFYFVNCSPIYFCMHLKTVDTFNELRPEKFKSDYYNKNIPVVIKGLSKKWPALQKWTWQYFIDIVGDKKVGVYNNIKSDSYTPINTADDYMLFGEYLEKAQKGPLDLRIFLFNIFQHAPQLTADFTWPDEYMTGFVKKFPMLFVGGQGAVTHMHFDIDMSHILHTQFTGKKRVLLFPFKEQYKLYRKPWEVLSVANFENYHQNFDYENFPAVKNAEGFEVILEHGDTLFMPAGYWHHMEYIEAGYAMSLRALQSSLSGKLEGVWRLFGMRGIDTLMKKTFPKYWYNRKLRAVYKNARNAM